MAARPACCTCGFLPPFSLSNLRWPTRKLPYLSPTIYVIGRRGTGKSTMITKLLAAARDVVDRIPAIVEMQGCFELPEKLYNSYILFMHEDDIGASIAERFPTVPAALARVGPFQGVVFDTVDEKLFAAPA